MNGILPQPKTQPESKPETLREASLYTLSVQDAVALFDAAGVPRSDRSIQIYCSNGHLDCISVDSEHTAKYLISKPSIDRRISALRQIETAKNMVTKLRVVSGSSAKVREVTDDENRVPDSLRKAATSEIAFLREQMRVKDTQIKSMLERDQETNILIKGLQDFLHKLPALQAPSYEPPAGESYREYTEVEFSHPANGLDSEHDGGESRRGEDNPHGGIPGSPV